MTLNSKRHLILIGISLGTLLLVIATLYYPGGSYENVNAAGYDWIDNYISNLLSPLAVNGAENTARPFAVLGVLLLTSSFGAFFVKFSRRIKIRSAALVIKYLGVAATLFGLLTVIPSLHDPMVTLSSILTLLIFFYITVMVLKSKLTLMKVMSIAFLLTFYFAAYMYFSRFMLQHLPLMQKTIFLMKIIWILCLEYLTREEDFQHITK